jgi:adenylate kinase family enzyme
MNESFPYRRIIVIGTTGSGKSALGEKLASKLNLEFIELDALHWLPDWKHITDEALRDLVDKATRTDNWVIAGNYSVTRDITWPCAEALIWLD